MRDPVYQAELDHDQSGFTEKQLAPYLQEALDGMIDDLFSGKKVGGFHLDAYVEQFASEIAAQLVAGFPQDTKFILEPLIRRELEGSDELHEMAAELANQPPEE